MQDRADELTFPERLGLRLPRGLGDALAEVAARQHTTRSEVIRQTLIREVEAHGLTLEPELREVAADIGGNDGVAEALDLVARITKSREAAP